MSATLLGKQAEMAQPPLSVAELLKDESFISYCTQKDEKDISYWENYVREHPSAKEIIEEAKQEYHLLFSALATADLDEQLGKLRKKVEAADETANAINTALRYRGSFLRRYRYALAAMLVLLLTAGYYLWKIKRAGAALTETSRHYAAERGERKNFQLPDGSSVTLNAGSSITLDEKYGLSSRGLYLQGEAFFDVQPGIRQPFTVHTDNMDLVASGTAFNVNAYGGEEPSEAVLIRGLVEITLKKDGNRKVTLHAGEKICWSTGGSAGAAHKSCGIVVPVTKMDDAVPAETAWTTNTLVFDNETWEEAASRLSRWYAVTIKFASAEVKQLRVSGIFRNEKIERVLEMMQSSQPFHYRVNEQQVIVIGY